MIRIRRIYDAVLPINKEAVRQAQTILRTQIADLDPGEIASLPDKLRDPLRHRFRSILFVAEGARHRISGFAVLMHEPALRLCYLDLISTSPTATGGGIGGALYERVRYEARELGAIGLFFECLPDDPAKCGATEKLRENRARLRFYEQFGARPIIGTAYETPASDKDTCPPFLVFDDLGTGRNLRRREVRRIIAAILERKYPKLCPPEYVARVVNSLRDDPVRLREPRYQPEPRIVAPPGTIPDDRKITLVVNDRYDIHHVRERGYVESPVRVPSILRGLDPTGLFARRPVRHFADSHVLAVHDVDFFRYLKRVCLSVEPGESVFPYVFPIRNAARPPKELSVRAGYYCIDTFTPLNRNAFLAARRAVDAALTAAQAVLDGDRLAYALVRPPGHHAERRAFGGFCYFNSTAIAANYLSRSGKVAILDVDYHHGNGQQVIFARRRDVLTVSIHGHPGIAYPYFSGFAEEIGEGPGKGFNVNFPLPEKVDGPRHHRALQAALARIKAFDPKYLVVALGFDPAKGDPTGTWSLGAADFEANGKLIGSLNLPTLLVQEGGYKTRMLGTVARAFFTGLWTAAIAGEAPPNRPKKERKT